MLYNVKADNDDDAAVTLNGEEAVAQLQSCNIDEFDRCKHHYSIAYRHIL
jgi:hypothetical protein